MVDKTRLSRAPRPPFYTSIACWIDLLGYGRMISRARFSPTHAEAKSAIDRLRRFHRLVADHSSSRFPTFVINDGAVAYRDLSYISHDRTLPFLHNAWRLFEAVNAERDAGQAGARMVVAAGFRMSGRRAGGENEAARRRELVQSVERGERSIEQAVESAARGAAYFDVIPQLQANFAFTTAYLAEDSGSEGGLPGAHCYVDQSLFGNGSCGIDFGQTIAWRHPDLDLRRDFAPIMKADERSTSTAAGIRTGYEVASALTGEVEVHTALRAHIEEARQFTK